MVVPTSVIISSVVLDMIYQFINRDSYGNDASFMTYAFN